MYNNSYEEYIRSVLGYPNENQANYTPDYSDYNYNESRSSELEDCYPEIYKIVYPMVKKACQNIQGEVTKDDIDRMVDELYFNIEGNDDINININLNKIENVNTVKTENRKETRFYNGKKVIEEPKRPENPDKPKIENRSIEKREDRQFNRGLSDIIRILLLRELLGRPGCMGGSCKPGPGMGPRPPRPPFPPPGPGRPPFFRDLDNDIFEY